MKSSQPVLFSLLIWFSLYVVPCRAFDLQLTGLVNYHPYIEAPSSTFLTIEGINLNIGDVNGYICHYSDGQNTYSDTVLTKILSPPNNNWFTHTLNTPIPLAKSEIKVITIWIESTIDPNPANDTIRTTIHGLTMVPKKVVVLEDGESTTCEWCPRGYVILDSLMGLYQDSLAAVAIHTSWRSPKDPMEIKWYGDWMWSNVPGIPGGVVDRKFTNLNTNQYQQMIADQLVQAPPAAVYVSGTINNQSNYIDIDIEVEMAIDLTGDYRVNVILIENSVTGTSSDYDQWNNYANNQNGPMGIYSSLPHPVPASQMVYDYVARALGGGIQGDSGSLPNQLVHNQTYPYQYTISLDSVDNPNNIELVAIMTDGITGEILNAGKGSVPTGTMNAKSPTFSLYPNPTSDIAYLNFYLDDFSEVNLTVFDLSGRTVVTKGYGPLNGYQLIPIPVVSFKPGFYLISLKVDEFDFTTTLIVH